MSETYLDAASTAKYGDIEPIIINAMTRAMEESWQNPSSLYATHVKDKIDKCRLRIARFIGAKADEIYFTSGASEANNWAIHGWADKEWENKYYTPNIITTYIEHKSIIRAVENECLRAFVRFCDVDEFGMMNLNSLEYMLSQCEDESVLVSVCMANNEIGTIQHIRMISDLVHKCNGVLHVDATQALGHIPINVEELGIDMMSCSGHKISPVLKGIGFLYKRNGINIKPLIYGNQEHGLRGGTENTFGIIGLGKAIEYCDVGNEMIEYMINIRDYFINQLESKFGCKLNGHNEYRLPNNINVVLPDGISGESVLYMLETSDIFISTSSACNSHSITPSHVLKAIGLTDEEAMRSIRITISNDTTYEDVDYFINELDKIIKIIKG